MKFLKKKAKASQEGEQEAAGGAAEEKEEKKAPAEGEGEAAGGEAAPAAKSKKKKLIIIGAAVAVLALGGGGAFMFLGGKGKHAEEEAAAAASAGKEGQPVYFEMPQILVNLNTGGKQVSFIKTTVTLELSSAADMPTVQANLPRLVDSYNTFLREMRASDLYGSSGAYRLREEMLARANKVLAPAKVQDVLFKELIVQ